MTGGGAALTGAAITGATLAGAVALGLLLPTSFGLPLAETCIDSVEAITLTNATSITWYFIMVSFQCLKNISRTPAA